MLATSYVAIVAEVQRRPGQSRPAKMQSTQKTIPKISVCCSILNIEEATKMTFVLKLEAIVLLLMLQSRSAILRRERELNFQLNFKLILSGFYKVVFNKSYFTIFIWMEMAFFIFPETAAICLPLLSHLVSIIWSHSSNTALRCLQHALM